MNETNMNADDSRPASGFDPEKAARLRSDAVDRFSAQMRKIERWLYAYLALGMLIACYATWRFFLSHDVQAWILFGVVFVVGFEITVLIKLWYWIVNNKLAVLREIKLLRLDLAIQTGAPAADKLVQAESPLRPPGLSRAERIGWNVVILAIALGIGFSWNAPYWVSRLRGSRMTSERSVILDADGTGRMETVYSLENSRRRIIREFPIYAGGAREGTQYLAPAESSWTDGFGRRLPVRIEPAGPNHRNVIALPQPVRPGERFTIRGLSKTEASREGDTWTYTMSQNWGCTENHYIDAVTLPVGAAVVSVEPSPALRETKDGRPVLRFDATLGSNARWQYTVKYRLAASPQPPGKDPSAAR